MASANGLDVFPAAYAIIKRGNRLRLYVELGRKIPIDTISFSEYFELPIVHHGVFTNIRQYSYLKKVVDNAKGHNRGLDFEFLDQVLQEI